MTGMKLTGRIGNRWDIGDVPMRFQGQMRALMKPYSTLGLTGPGSADMLTAKSSMAQAKR